MSLSGPREYSLFFQPNSGGNKERQLKQPVLSQVNLKLSIVFLGEDQ